MDFITGNVTVEEVKKENKTSILTSYKKNHIKNQIKVEKEKTNA